MWEVKYFVTIIFESAIESGSSSNCNYFPSFVYHHLRRRFPSDQIRIERVHPIRQYTSKVKRVFRSWEEPFFRN